jgi:hypothetical protein
MSRMIISTLPISSEYAAAMLDTRGMIHTNGRSSPTLTLHMPQRDVAEALTDYWGDGTLDTYRPARNPEKTFNVITVSGPTS